MTAIAAFLRKTPVIRLQDYFTAGGFTSLAPIDWTKPEPEVVEPLIKAVDAMTGDPSSRLKRPLKPRSRQAAETKGKNGSFKSFNLSRGTLSPIRVHARS